MQPNWLLGSLFVSVSLPGLVSVPSNSEQPCLPHAAPLVCHGSCWTVGKLFLRIQASQLGHRCHNGNNTQVTTVLESTESLVSFGSSCNTAPPLVVCSCSCTALATLIYCNRHWRYVAATCLITSRTDMRGVSAWSW